MSITVWNNCKTSNTKELKTSNTRESNLQLLELTLLIKLVILRYTKKTRSIKLVILKLE